MREIKPGEEDMHLKTSTIRCCLLKNLETNGPYVVYQALYGAGEMWIRPYEMFVSEVDREKYPDVGQQYRFEEIRD